LAIDDQGKQIKPSVIGEVQLDFFVGNYEWMKVILSAPPEDSLYKAVHRNTLLTGYVKHLFFYEDDEIMSYHIFDLRDGIKHRIKNKKLKTKKDIEVITNPIKMAQQFFNVASWEEINSFEKVLTFLKANHWYGKRSEIIKSFEIHFKKSKLDVPQIIYD
jgi:hypothetical protein